MSAHGLRRISVVGTSGSGKTTLAKQLSKLLGHPHIELDALHWLPGWRERPMDEFKSLVADGIAAGAWVVEGNYKKVREAVWERATHVVWLNMPFHVVFIRMLIRCFKRAFTREVLWSGNREGFRISFFSKDSMLLWVINTHAERKREYRALFQDPRFAHLVKTELTSQAAIDAFVEGLPRPQTLVARS